MQVHPGELWVSKQRMHIVLEASKSAGAKGDVPKICGFAHPLHAFPGNGIITIVLTTPSIPLVSSGHNYRTRAIITRGLYIFTPFWKAKKRFFKEHYS
jgi:hypothetical protein